MLSSFAHSRQGDMDADLKDQLAKITSIAMADMNTTFARAHDEMAVRVQQVADCHWKGTLQRLAEQEASIQSRKDALDDKEQLLKQAQEQVEELQGVAQKNGERMQGEVVSLTSQLEVSQQAKLDLQVMLDGCREQKTKDKRERALLSKWNKQFQDSETELKTQVAKLESELEASKHAESRLQAELKGDDEVEEGREVGEEEEEEEEEWLYTEEDVANLVDAEVTQALKLATAPLEARVRELESHQAAPGLGAQLGTLQRQLQDSRRAGADMWRQVELLREEKNSNLLQQQLQEEDTTAYIAELQKQVISLREELGEGANKLALSVEDHENWAALEAEKAVEEATAPLHARIRELSNALWERWDDIPACADSPEAMLAKTDQPIETSPDLTPLQHSHQCSNPEGISNPEGTKVDQVKDSRRVPKGRQSRPLYQPPSMRQAAQAEPRGNEAGSCGKPSPAQILPSAHKSPPTQMRAPAHSPSPAHSPPPSHMPAPARKPLPVQAPGHNPGGQQAQDNPTNRVGNKPDRAFHRHRRGPRHPTGKPAVAAKEAPAAEATQFVKRSQGVNRQQRRLQGQS